MSKSNLELIEFLSKCDADSLFTLMEMLDSIFIWESPFSKISNSSQIPKPGTSDRNQIALEAVNLLRYYGSHTIAYNARKIFSGEPGVDYSEVLRNVTSSIAKSAKLPVPRVATTSELELLLTESILRIQFKDKSEAEIASMLKEAGLDSEQIELAAKQFSKFAAGGVGIITLVKFLGKKTIKEFLERTIIWIIAKKFGKEAAEKIAITIFKKTAQKSIAKLISGFGVALLAWDVVDLGSPATRQTVPCVALIAALRTMERQKE